MDYTKINKIASDIIMTVQPGEIDVLSGIVSGLTNAGFSSVSAKHDEFGGVNISYITPDGKKIMHGGIHYLAMPRRSPTGWKRPANT